MIRETRARGTAAERYARLKGRNVIIYYRDMRDTDRNLHGTLIDTDGDILWLENGEWTGSLDCRNARVTLVSTIEGWGAKPIEIKEEGRETIGDRIRRMFGR